ncbi:MAG TPA: ATP-binding protein [Pedobacter sp.]|jgi:signal transduction histidine kinase
MKKEPKSQDFNNTNKTFLLHRQEEEQRAAELIIANKELTFQNGEKEKRAAELVIANLELAFQNGEKEKRAAELVIANKELTFQNQEKEKRAAELIVANLELAFQNKEKEKRAAELIIANEELTFQNQEKEKRAAELIIANLELAFQNKEKEKRAAELIIANEELTFQNQEKEKRAAELVIANLELAFQNQEKEKRAAELVIANEELAFQNLEKEKRASDLFTANEELKIAKSQIVDLNVGLEQKIIERTSQLEAANHELESFSYSISHDLRSPLRAINGFTQVLAEDYADKIDEDGRSVMAEIISNSIRMGELIDNLLEFSQIGKQRLSIANINMKDLVESVIKDLQQQESHRKINVSVKPLANSKGDRNLITQVLINLISNAFKYTGKEAVAHVEIGSYTKNDQEVYYVKDNGVGFDMRYYEKLFGVFQRLHSNNEFEGTGVGLAIIHRIITKHSGKVWAEAKVDEGACFYFSLPSTNIT